MGKHHSATMTGFDQNQIPGLSPAQANQSHRRIKTPQHAAPEWITSTQHHAVSNNAVNTGSDFGMGFGERAQPMSARRVKADANNAPDWMNTGNTQTDYSQGSYGIGNRIIEDRHVHQPLGGEIEAGYGIGNRVLSDSHSHVTHKKSNPSSNQQSSSIHLGGDEQAHHISEAQYSANLNARIQSRPF